MQVTVVTDKRKSQTIMAMSMTRNSSTMTKISSSWATTTICMRMDRAIMATKMEELNHIGHKYE